MYLGRVKYTFKIVLENTMFHALPGATCNAWASLSPQGETFEALLVHTRMPQMSHPPGTRTNDGHLKGAFVALAGLAFVRTH